jgi:hypothetical protein
MSEACVAPRTSELCESHKHRKQTWLALWTNIDWLLIRAPDVGVPSFGIDHITFAVPAAVSEPATISLLLISLLMWVYMRVKTQARSPAVRLTH